MSIDPHHDPHCGEDVAAYALGALDGGEVAAFEAHLEQCAVCRDELAAFQEVVQALPMSVSAQRPPRHLKRDVMAAVAAEPKRTAATAGRPERARRRRAWLGQRPQLGLAALAAAAVIVVGALSLNTGAGTRVIRAQVIGISGTAQVRLSGGHAELVVSHLAPPPSGHIYEVWLSRGAGQASPTSALFSVTRGGAGDVDVPGSLRGVRTVMVTPEPTGGSRVPTHAPVIRANLT